MVLPPPCIASSVPKVPQGVVVASWSKQAELPLALPRVPQSLRGEAKRVSILNGPLGPLVLWRAREREKLCKLA